MSENVEHPAHYGGKDNPYEVIKVAEAWGFMGNAYLFNVLKYIARPGKGHTLEDLKKARWYLDRLIARLEGKGYELATESLAPAEPWKFPEPVAPTPCQGCLGFSSNHACGSTDRVRDPREDFH